MSPADLPSQRGRWPQPLSYSYSACVHRFCDAERWGTAAALGWYQSAKAQLWLWGHRGKCKMPANTAAAGAQAPPTIATADDAWSLVANCRVQTTNSHLGHRLSLLNGSILFTFSGLLSAIPETSTHSSCRHNSHYQSNQSNSPFLLFFFFQIWATQSLVERALFWGVTRISTRGRRGRPRSPEGVLLSNWSVQLKKCVALNSPAEKKETMLQRAHRRQDSLRSFDASVVLLRT